MPTKLKISNYKSYRNVNDIGHVAKFSLNGTNNTGVILQYVKHSTCFNNEKPIIRKFTECWIVNNDKIEHNGKDYFLIPTSYYTTSGTVSLTAEAWFVKGNINTILNDLKMDDNQINSSPVSGMLLSEKGKVPLKYRRKSGVKRVWCVSWSKHRSKKAFDFDQVVHWREK